MEYKKKNDVQGKSKFYQKYNMLERSCVNKPNYSSS